METNIEKLDKLIIAEQKNKKKGSPVCMECGSKDLTLPQTPAKIYFRELKSYYCRNCGFEGPAILKNWSKAKNLK
jgi:predicted RNA-binding Zn-ribbon protein involved in translation (DUF1610 family)